MTIRPCVLERFAQKRTFAVQSRTSPLFVRRTRAYIEGTQSQGIDTPMNSRFAVLLLFGLSFAFGLANAASEFRYKIPDGWWDLREAQRPGPNQKNMDNVPLKLTQDATSGTFAVVAIDPQTTKFNRVGASFNAVEAPTTGRITLEEMEKFGPALMAQFKAKGLSANLLEVKVDKFNGVKVGVIRFNATDLIEGQERTLVQYVIPGRKGAAVLTYSAPKASFNSYAAMFEDSARATKGGYEAGGFNWIEFFAMGAIGGLVGLGVTFMRKRRAGATADVDGGVAVSAAPKTPAPAKKVTSKYVWDCPGCGKPVPLRLEQCRCGTARPA
jgi:hypothetical protein